MRRLLTACVLIACCTPAVRAEWTRMSGPTAPPASEFLLHEGRWYLGTDHADQGDVFRSDDGGWTWRDVGLPNGGVASALSHQGELWVGTYLGGLHRSADGGATWTDVTPAEVGFSTVEALIAADAQTLYAGLDPFFGVPVHKSTDGGATWQPLSAGPSLRCYDLALVDGVLLAGGEDLGVWRSADGGATWAQAVSGLPAMADAHRFARRDTTVFLAAEAVGHSMAVYRSDDRGLTWQQVSQDIPQFPGDICSALAFHAGALHLAMSGTWGDRGLYRSLDDGGTWTRLTDDLGTTDPSVTAVAFPDGDLMVGTRQGVFRSGDDGATWTPAWQGASGICGGTSLLDVDGRLLVGNAPQALTAPGLQWTDDGGTDWTAPVGPAVLGDAVAFLRHDGVVYAGVRSPFRGVMASSDGGLAFGPLGAGFSASTSVLCLAAHGGSLFAGAWEGLYRSDDGGATWTLQPQPGAVNALIEHQGALYAGLYPGGVARSDDLGLTWSPLNDGLGAAHINALTVFGGELYAAVNVVDVMRLDDGAWTPTGLPDHAPNDLLAVDGVLLACTASNTVWATADGLDWTPFSENLTAGILEGLAVTGDRVAVISRTRGVWTRPRADLPAATAVDPTPAAAAPALSASPNPFNPHTVIRLERPAAGPAELTLHDAAGRRVRRAPLPAGAGSWTWDGRDDAGRALPSGLYLARLHGAESQATIKIMLMR